MKRAVTFLAALALCLGLFFAAPAATNSGKDSNKALDAIAAVFGVDSAAAATYCGMGTYYSGNEKLVYNAHWNEPVPGGQGYRHIHRYKYYISGVYKGYAWHVCNQSP